MHEDRDRKDYTARVGDVVQSKGYEGPLHALTHQDVEGIWRRYGGPMTTLASDEYAEGEQLRFKARGGIPTLWQLRQATLPAREGAGVGWGRYDVGAHLRVWLDATAFYQVRDRIVFDHERPLWRRPLIGSEIAGQGLSFSLQPHQIQVLELERLSG